MKVKAAIGMGSNQGDRLQNMKMAARAIKELDGCEGFHFSALYQTAAVDCPEPFEFLNAVVCLRTSVPPRKLLHQLLAIEQEQGRRRSYPNAPRPLDLDLLLYGSLIMETPELSLPHPRMDQRLFVLAPLVEIWPDAQHPIKDQTAMQLQTTLLEDSLEQDVTKSLQPW